MRMDETTQSSEHSVVMKCRRVAFGAGKGCLREGTLFTDIEDMTVISHKMTPNDLFLRLTPFCRFFLGMGKTE